MKKLMKVLAAVLALTAGLTACGQTAASGSTSGAQSAAANGSGLEDGVLTVAMECAYAPYNWTQADDSNGAVPIKDSTEYANGYDVMMAKKLPKHSAWSWKLCARIGIL